MPSMFEPCGLSQMIALRYGTLPIARETGGLRDTVLSYNEFTGEGNGFTFLNYNAHDMLHVIERAVHMYHDDRATFNFLAKRAMQGLYGWDQSAQQYLNLYRDLTGIFESPAPVESAAEPAPAVESAPEKPKKPRTPRKKKEDAPAEKKPRAPRKKKTEE